jgi:hypothetical protein
MLDVREAGGAMHRTDRHRAPLLTGVRFGFDRERLFVRVDAVERVVDLLAGGRELSLKFVRPEGIRFSIRQVMGRLTGTFWVRQPASGVPAGGAFDWQELGPGEAAVAAGSILEVAVPLAALSLDAGQPLTFFVAIYDAGGAEIERHPEHRVIEVTTPDEMFEGRYWRA